MTKTTTNGKQVWRDASHLATYSNFWAKTPAEDAEVHQDNRESEYQTLVNGFYSGAIDFYEYGWGRSWHFARHRIGETFPQAIARHQHYLALQTGLRPGMRVLDVGSGVGGPAMEIGPFADVTIVGINNNEQQVDRSNKYSKQKGLQDQVSFVKGDYTKCAKQFGPQSFDAAFSIEATVHAPTLEAVYGQIYQVLKPGGTFGIYEWCLTDKYDASNAEHRRLCHLIEIGNGIPHLRTIQYAHEALLKSGFEVVHHEDIATRNDNCPWYWMLEGNIRKCPTYSDLTQAYPCTPVGMIIAQTVCKVLETVGIAPKGSYELGWHLNRTARALAEAGKLGIFTPMALFVSRKPADGAAATTNGAA